MSGEGTQNLTWDERRLLTLLGLPTFALSLTVTLVASFVPVLLEDQSGPAVTGLLIGMEGLFALTLPLVLGSISDRLHTRVGGRLPFVIAAAPVGALALIALPFTDSMPVTIAALAVYFAAYYVYFTPYWAMYPDLVPRRARGRSQGFMSTWRLLGLGGALVGGNLLIAAWEPLPFVVGAAVLVASTAFFAVVIRRRAMEADGDEGDDGEAPSPADRLRVYVDMIRSEPALGWILGANALWELALNALRTFVVLYLVVGLERSHSFASLVLAVVAVSAGLAAPLAGTLADRIGHERVLGVGLLLYGPGLLLPLLTQSAWAFPAFVAVAFGAGAVMSLPFSLVMGVLGERDHGAAAGLFGLSRGVGLLLGPALAGLAVVTLEPVFEDTQGYAAIFPVAALAVIASIPVIRRALRDT
jgi:MFS family permease